MAKWIVYRRFKADNGELYAKEKVAEFKYWNDADLFKAEIEKTDKAAGRHWIQYTVQEAGKMNITEKETKEAREIIDYLLTHNKNYTKAQYNAIDRLAEILKMNGEIILVGNDGE